MLFRSGELRGLLVLNGSLQDTEITLPDASALEGSGAVRNETHSYELLLSTAADADGHTGTRLRGGERDVLPANSVSLYRA